MILLGAALAIAVISAVVQVILATFSAVSPFFTQNVWLLALGRAYLIAALPFGVWLWMRGRDIERQRAQQRRQWWVAQEQARQARAAWEYQQWLARQEEERQRHLAKLRTISGLLSLTPTEFERAVCNLLVAQGYRSVRHSGGAGDLNADVTCESPQGQAVVVQCKRYSPHNLVGSPEVQTFVGMAQVHHKADRGIFVTTSGYTAHANELAKSNSDFITLIDGNTLAEMMRSAFVETPWKQVAQ
jgi:restriction endonuclease Mrr